MYQNVYLHKTTRGFEKLLEAMWNRAKNLHEDGVNLSLVPELKLFWTTEESKRNVTQYLRLEEHVVLAQIQAWTVHIDKPLSDLARRFLARDGFAMISPPSPRDDLNPDYTPWESALKKLAKEHGYADPDMYCLPDTIKTKYMAPYISPEKEAGEQSSHNAIRLLLDGGKPVEVTERLERLKAVTRKTTSDKRRYYVPKEIRVEAKKLAASMQGSADSK